MTTSTNCTKHYLNNYTVYLQISKKSSKAIVIRCIWKPPINF